MPNWDDGTGNTDTRWEGRVANSHSAWDAFDVALMSDAHVAAKIFAWRAGLPPGKHTVELRSTQYSGDTRWEVEVTVVERTVTKIVRDVTDTQLISETSAGERRARAKEILQANPFWGGAEVYEQGPYARDPHGTIYYLDDFEVLEETEKGIRLRTPADDGGVWFPKSQTQIMEPPFHGMTTRDKIFAIKEWLLETRGKDTRTMALPWKTYHWDG